MKRKVVWGMKDIEHSQQIFFSSLGFGKPAAFDLMVTSTLNSSTLIEVGVTSGSAALAAEVCKHNFNNAKCVELGWSCIPHDNSYGVGVGCLCHVFVTPLATRGTMPKASWQTIDINIYGQT